MMRGRDFVTPSDVVHVAAPVLSVRLLTNTADVAAAIERLLQSVPAPEYQ